MLPRDARPAGDRRRTRGRRRDEALVAARQAVPAARHPHPRLHVVPGVGRRHAVPERVRRREHQGRVEEPSRHAAGRDGAGRRARAAREQATAPLPGRHRSGHGRAVQQQESRQARHLAQRPASEGPGDRATSGRDVGHRRGRLLARRARQLGPRLRRAARRSSRTSSTSSSRAWARRARTAASAPSGPIANAFAGLSEMSGLPEPAMPAGWGYSYLDWMGAYSFALAMLTGALPPRPHRAKGSGSTPRSPRSGLFISGTAHPRLVGQRPRSGRATATARRTSRRRRTASIPAPGTIAGSPSRASPTRSGAR